MTMLCKDDAPIMTRQKDDALMAMQQKDDAIMIMQHKYNMVKRRPAVTIWHKNDVPMMMQYKIHFISFLRLLGWLPFSIAGFQGALL